MIELLAALVISVHDGDTITVKDKQHQQYRIRLEAIDAPERKQPYGLKSKQMLSDLVAGKQIDLVCPDQDRYQRLVCTIYSGDININELMVKQGGAWVYDAYYSGIMWHFYEINAKFQKLGLWNTTEYQSIPPWEWRKAKRGS